MVLVAACHRASGDFKLPVPAAAGSISKGEVDGGGHIGAGELRQPTHHPLPCCRFGDVAAPEQQVTVMGEP